MANGSFETELTMGAPGTDELLVRRAHETDHFKDRKGRSWRGFGVAAEMAKSGWKTWFEDRILSPRCAMICGLDSPRFTGISRRKLKT